MSITRIIGLVHLAIGVSLVEGGSKWRRRAAENGGAG